MAKKKIKEILKSPQAKTRIVEAFYVEALWPCTCDDKDKKKCFIHSRNWGRYKYHVFNDRRNPNKQMDGYNSIFGNFEKENKDVAKKRLEKNPYTGFIVNHPVFDNAKDALAYAERLSEFGELACKYSSTHLKGWEQNYSGKIETRVMRECDILILEEIKQC